MEQFRAQGGRGIQIGDEESLCRGDVLLKGALAVGAIYGTAAVGPYVRSALATGRGGDVEVLNFLLPFEYLQVSIYNRAKSETNDKGEKLPLKTDQKKLIQTLLEEDGQHVSALAQMIEKLGGKPVDKGSYAFAFRFYETFLQLSGEIETTAIGAYNGAIPSIKSADARELASSIVQVDGRHAASVLIPNEELPAPVAFDRGLDENSAITQVEKFTGIFPEYE